MPHTGGQDLVGLDALVGGFVVVDEQCLVEQEATRRAAAGEARWRPLERGATQLVAGRLEALGDAGQFHEMAPAATVRRERRSHRTG